MAELKQQICLCRISDATRDAQTRELIAAGTGAGGRVRRMQSDHQYRGSEFPGLALLRHRRGSRGGAVSPAFPRAPNRALPVAAAAGLLQLVRSGRLRGVPNLLSQLNDGR